MEVIVFIIVAVVCYLASAVIHEMGHVLCGLLHHWKLFMLVIGPVKLYRESMDSKLKVGIEKNPSLWAGAGGTLPQKESEENIEIWGKILLAGPFTSILFGILMLPVFIVTKSMTVLLLCLMPIAMGAMCIIPLKMKTGILYNDGTRYKRLRNGGQEGAEERALFKLIEVSLFGGNEAIYPAELVEPLLASVDPDLQYYGYHYSYLNAIRQDRPDAAEEQRSNMESIRNKVAKAIVDDCQTTL